MEFRGSVFRPDHKPLAGARVVLLYDHDGTGYGSAVLGQTQTDKDGRYQLAAEEPRFEPLALAARPSHLIIFVTCAAHAPAVVIVNPNSRSPIDVELASGRKFTCLVTNEKGPLPGAEVGLAGIALFQAGKPFEVARLPGPSPISVRAAADGRATVLDLPPTEVTLRVSAAGHAPAFVRIRKQEEALTTRLSRAREFRGMVKDEATGAPLSGMVVRFRASSGFPVRWTITDDKGRYSMTVARSPVGARALVALDPRPVPEYAPGAVRLPDAGDEDVLPVDLSMPRGYAVRGRVVHEKTHAPIPGVTVQLRGGQGNVEMLRRTDAKGAYQGVTTGGWLAVKPLALTPPGLILLSELPHAKWIWVLENKQIADIDLVFQRALTAMFIVRDADGKPVPGAHVSAQYGAGPLREVTADARGQARFSDVPEDIDFAIHGSSPAYTGAAFRTARILSDRPAQVTELRLRPTARLAVSTTDANGWPLPADLELWVDQKRPAAAAGDPAGPALAVRVLSRKSNGDAVLPGLLPGVQYRISAVAAAPQVQLRGPRRLQKMVTIVAGQENPAVEFQFDARQTNRPWTLKPYVSIDEQIARLGKAVWTKKDAADPDLTWIKIEGGLGLADSRRAQVQRFFNFFGYRRFTVNAIAFGKDKVWIGADVGLFAWDRTHRFWTRYAVNAAILEANVSDLKITDKQELVVAVQPGKGPKATYIYDPADMRWRPQGKTQ